MDHKKMNRTSNYQTLNEFYITLNLTIINIKLNKKELTNN